MITRIRLRWMMCSSNMVRVLSCCMLTF
jgi:hypothetical protein